ncbi:MAG: hypothetical protein HOE90_11160 [Bacteriovoracaceae bacterium]|jgi:hypothetical protein|nr:hypothetical protein [Bacteriovoracaceae bacterium]
MNRCGKLALLGVFLFGVAPMNNGIAKSKLVFDQCNIKVIQFYDYNKHNKLNVDEGYVGQDMLDIFTDAELGGFENAEVLDLTKKEFHDNKRDDFEGYIKDNLSDGEVYASFRTHCYKFLDVSPKVVKGRRKHRKKHYKYNLKCRIAMQIGSIFQTPDGEEHVMTRMESAGFRKKNLRFARKARAHDKVELTDEQLEVIETRVDGEFETERARRRGEVDREEYNDRLDRIERVYDEEFVYPIHRNIHQAMKEAYVAGVRKILKRKKYTCKARQ